MAVHRGGTSGRDPYKRLTGSALSAAAGFTVDSVRAVYDGSASTSKFLVWLEVLARGLVVQELAGAKTRIFSPAYEQVKAAVYFDPQFEQTQPTLVERFKLFANMPKGQWKRAAEPDRKAHDIKTLEDFRMFMLGIQRVPSNSTAFLGTMPPATARLGMELSATNRRRPSLAAGGKSQPRRGIHLVLMVSEIGHDGAVL